MPAAAPSRCRQLRGSAEEPSRPQLSTAALEQSHIVQRVLGFASADGYLFAGCVSRLWRESWLGLPQDTESRGTASEANSGEGGESGSAAISAESALKLPKVTPFAAVVTSVSRLTWALDSQLTWNSRLSIAAANLERGIDVLKWGLAHGDIRFQPTRINVGGLVGAAAAAGHLETIRWARASGSGLEQIVYHAACSGHLHIIQWARANGYQWDLGIGGLDAAALCEAATNGHFGVVKWLWNNGCPRDGHYYSVCASAARSGHLEILQWLRAHGARWDAHICSFAAAGGHLGVIQWARAGGCPWRSEACLTATNNGHLEVLQWLRANGCPWHRHTCLLANRGTSSRKQEVIDWVHANGCPCEHTGIPFEDEPEEDFWEE